MTPSSFGKGEINKHFVESLTAVIFPRLERRLKATLIADVHGYSRFMGDDEPATVRTVAAYRETDDGTHQPPVGPGCRLHWRNLPAEFPGLSTQWSAPRRNGSSSHAVPNSPGIAACKSGSASAWARFSWRARGIYRGDAYRGSNPEPAEAGGICVSGMVHDQVANKVTLDLESLGEQTVKNMARLVAVRPKDGSRVPGMMGVLAAVIDKDPVIVSYSLPAALYAARRSVSVNHGPLSMPDDHY